LSLILQISDGRELDILKDIPISLNYSIADVREPNKRNASFSKTIMLPGNKNNNNILEHSYEIDLVGGFNPNLKLDVNLLEDGVTVIQGYLQLLEIITEEGQVIYKVSVVGDTGDFFNAIEGLN